MRLRRADCSSAGWSRRKVGRGFVYLDERGRRITDAETLARLKALAIPPAWTDVWICPWPNGHLQAVGTDAAGRRQYRYHDVWRMKRDREKFDHMLEFAAALPALRRKCTQALATEELHRDKVLACATRLLDLGFFRIGTEGYAEQNQSYGLATIRKSHVKVTADGIVAFDYVAKGGKRRIQSVVDPEVHAGGITSAAMRSRVAWSVTLLPFWSTYVNPLPALRRRIPGDEQSMRFRRGMSPPGHERRAGATSGGATNARWSRRRGARSRSAPRPS